VPKSPSAATWRRAIREALGGDLRNLLDLLLLPATDGGADFYELPSDPVLRAEVVLCLLAGPWSKLSELQAKDLQQLRTHTGWGSAKRRSVSELEIGAAELLARSGADDVEIESLAEALGRDGATIKGRIKARKKRKELPQG
jgi:hypothetical protein